MCLDFFAFISSIHREISHHAIQSCGAPPLAADAGAIVRRRGARGHPRRRSHHRRGIWERRRGKIHHRRCEERAAQPLLPPPAPSARRRCAPTLSCLVLAAVNLAVALAHNLGLRVGVLDADVYGPSIPRLLNLHGRPDVDEGAPPAAPARLRPAAAALAARTIDRQQGGVGCVGVCVCVWGAGCTARCSAPDSRPALTRGSFPHRINNAPQRRGWSLCLVTGSKPFQWGT
jgi:hypothetical protein